MNRKDLGVSIYNASILHGKFKLRSGQESDTYFDKYKFEANPILLGEIAIQMAELIPDNVQVLAGLETGGIPLATALALHMRLPLSFVRKQAKDYGTKNLVEGENIESRNVLLVEDIITTAGQVVDCALALRQLGAIIEHGICVINRGGELPIVNLQSIGVGLISLFELKELKTWSTA